MPKKYQCPIRQPKVKEKPRQEKGKSKANQRKQKPKSTKESQTKVWPSLYKAR